MIDGHLQQYLRQFEVLQNVEVGYQSDMGAQVAPYLVTVHGMVPLHGNLHAFSCEVDMREINSQDDAQRLVKMLVLSFERAAADKSLH